jgi:diacylglycerol kinase (ATP)
MRVFINPICDYGRGLDKWRKVKDELRSRYGPFQTEQIQSPEKFLRQVKDAWKKGERLFISAGGDGTLNLLLNCLLNISSGGRMFVVGAVGLGSSNDFHKPFCQKRMVQKIPVRMDWKKAMETDVIRIDYQNGKSRPSSRFCLINASIGITAQANAFYNSRNFFISLLKKVGHDAAVVACALNTILTYSNIPCFLTLEENRLLDVSLTNLGVIKNPHFAGGLCYDQTIRPDDGDLGVNIGSGMSKLEAVRTLAGLYRRKFSEFTKTRSLRVKRISVKSDRSFALELDGEVVEASSAEFKILPRAVRCCR